MIFITNGATLAFLLVATMPRAALGLLTSPDTNWTPVSKLNKSPNDLREWGSLRAATTTPDEGEDGVYPIRESFRRGGMAAALCSTYFAVMGAKCALPSVLSQLTSPRIGLSFLGWRSTPQTLMANQLALSTCAVALGKLLLGPLIDNFGGVLALQACLSTLMVMLAIISLANNFITFAIAWIVVDFVFSSCWAACINAVHQSFPETEWAKLIGMIAAAARTGNASAFFMFAGVLQWSSKHLPPGAQAWRLVFGASSVLQLIPIALLSYFGSMKSNISDFPVLGQREGIKLSPKTTGPTTIKASLATLKRQASTPEFWLHLISRSTLMVFGSFLLFVPTLMEQVYGLSNSQAARVGSVLALGCLLSVTTCSQLYTILPKRTKITLSAAFLSIASMCSVVQLAHVAGIMSLSSSLSTLTMFMWGFSFAVPFYIPPSMFALARGGKESSATISDVFDVVGFVMLALFNGYVASIQHNNIAAWIKTFQILTGCAVTSLISLSLAIFFE